LLKNRHLRGNWRVSGITSTINVNSNDGAPIKSKSSSFGGGTVV